MRRGLPPTLHASATSPGALGPHRGWLHFPTPPPRQPRGTDRTCPGRNLVGQVYQLVRAMLMDWSEPEAQRSAVLPCDPGHRSIPTPRLPHSTTRPRGTSLLTCPGSSLVGQVYQLVRAACRRTAQRQLAGGTAQSQLDFPYRAQRPPRTFPVGEPYHSPAAVLFFKGMGIRKAENGGQERPGECRSAQERRGQRNDRF